MSDLPSMIANFDMSARELIPLVGVAGSMLVGLVFVIMWAVVSTVRSRESEKTRREIAAYVSEGSMTADEGERLMRSTKPSKSSCCV